MQTFGIYPSLWLAQRALAFQQGNPRFYIERLPDGRWALRYEGEL